MGRPAGRTPLSIRTATVPVGFRYPRPDPYRQIQIVSDIKMSLPAGDTLTKLILDRSRTSQTLKYMGKQNFPVKK
jgi:hypothetical protein